MGRKGNKNKKAERKRQHKALNKIRKRNATVRSRNIQRNAPKMKAVPNPMKAILKNFEDSGQATWWVANAINYLASDYDEGIWSPVFPEIYEAEHEITIEKIKTYLGEHFNAEDNTWTIEGRRAVGMVMSPVEAVFAFAQKCVVDAQAEELDPKAPKCDPVWKIFNIVKQELDSRMGDKHLSSTGTENTEETAENEADSNEAIES